MNLMDKINSILSKIEEVEDAMSSLYSARDKLSKKVEGAAQHQAYTGVYPKCETIVNVYDIEVSMDSSFLLDLVEKEIAERTKIIASEKRKIAAINKILEGDSNDK